MGATLNVPLGMAAQLWEIHSSLTMSIKKPDNLCYTSFTRCLLSNQLQESCQTKTSTSAITHSPMLNVTWSERTAAMAYIQSPFCLCTAKLPEKLI